jgi:hypothetical protein
VDLFDLQGRLVRRLARIPYLGSGVHEVKIDGRNSQGVPLASGVYFYSLQAPEGVKRGHVVVLK